MHYTYYTVVFKIKLRIAPFLFAFLPFYLHKVWCHGWMFTSPNKKTKKKIKPLPSWIIFPPPAYSCVFKTPNFQLNWSCSSSSSSSSDTMAVLWHKEKWVRRFQLFQVMILVAQCHFTNSDQYWHFFEKIKGSLEDWYIFIIYTNRYDIFQHGQMEVLKWPQLVKSYSAFHCSLHTLHFSAY